MSKNDITGDNLKSRPNSKAFDENFDTIFKAKKGCKECGFIHDDVHLKRHESNCSKAEIGQDYGRPDDIFGGGYPLPRGDRGI